MKIEINDISDIQTAAQTFIDNMSNYKVFAFYGEMGVGKTTFIKAICEKLGVEETITSPTFAIVNEYGANDGKTVYHFDFYRINKLQEAVDFGCGDYLYSGNLCFIEWPELIEPILPDETQKITIRETEDKKRVVEFLN